MMALDKLIARFTAWLTPIHAADEPAVEEVLTRYADSLMRIKGVMSVGVGRTDDGRPAVYLGIDSPKAASLGDLPSSLDGVPVIHRWVGRPEARPARRPEIDLAERTARRVARREFAEQAAEEPVSAPPPMPDAAEGRPEPTPDANATDAPVSPEDPGEGSLAE